MAMCHCVRLSILKRIVLGIKLIQMPDTYLRMACKGTIYMCTEMRKYKYNIFVFLIMYTMTKG